MIYYNQGDIRDMLVITYWWATSCRAKNIKNFTLAPSDTSQTLFSSSSASHTWYYTTSNLCKYLVMKPRHSSLMYPFVMDSSSFTIFCTQIFKLFMYLSTDYTKMRPSSLWVSLDFEWIWTFYHGEINQPPNEWGPIVMDNELFHHYLMKQNYFQMKYKFTKPFTY